MIVETEINELLNKLKKKATVDETKGEIKRLGMLVKQVLDEHEAMEHEITELTEEIDGTSPDHQRPYMEFLQSGGVPIDWMIKEFENA